MTDEIAPEVAQTSPEPEESSTPATDETVAAQETDSPPEPAEPKRSRAEERITGLVGDVHALKQAAEYWRVRALDNLEPSKPAVQPVSRPTLEDSDHDQERFATAMTDWAVDQATSAAKTQVDETLRLRAAEDEQATIKAQWQDKSEEFAEKHADFHDVIANPTIPISKDMADVFMESDMGPAIAYHFGKNPDIAARISRMTPRKMALAIGRLERDLTSPKPQPTRAPTPPTPVGGQQPDTDIAIMPIDDWMKHERERLYGKGRK